MFQSGLQRLHLRKPGSTINECRDFLRAIPSAYHSRIVVHEHYELLDEFGIGGVHLNSRTPRPSASFFANHPSISVSCSCHSIAELTEKKSEAYDYLSLSPIFNSISKQGYDAAFSHEELVKAKENGVIDHRVMALGGICHDNIDEAMAYGFGGVMVLGDAWNDTLNPPARGTFSPPVVLTIAGSDSSAGAGIQQDLKTATHCGCYAATVVTAITAQNTVGVQDVMPIPASIVESQLRSVFSDLRIDAVKIGMIPNREVAEAIVKVLSEERQKRILPIVADPVMISTSGTRLMAEDCVSTVVESLFPLCTLITPNIPEWEYLQSFCNGNRLSLSLSTLVKGGHSEGEEMTDILTISDTGDEKHYTSPRISTKNLHGTGCTLSSAIASFMAKGQSLATAVGNAKHIMDDFIRGGANLRVGHGNGPLSPWGSSRI